MYRREEFDEMAQKIKVPRLKADEVRRLVTEAWARMLGVLKEYVTIPAVSPAYAPNWDQEGYIAQAAALLAQWCRSRIAPDMTVKIVTLSGLTPVLYLQIPASAGSAGGRPPSGKVLLYGHFDKQPEMDGWEPGLGPWNPVIRDGKLYGRGGADDGYAVFASLESVLILRELGAPHAAVDILIEASEESGSIHLPQYLEALMPRIGKPDLVICLDSGARDYKHPWLTTSLRGLLNFTVGAKALTQAVHSGSASGIVPCPVLTAMALATFYFGPLLEDSQRLTALTQAYTHIPAWAKRDARRVVGLLGDELLTGFPWADMASRPQGDAKQLLAYLLANTWEPALVVTGAEGLPLIAKAGNVVLPSGAFKMSLRLPPGVSPDVVFDEIERMLSGHPLRGTVVEVLKQQTANGWSALPRTPWLEDGLTYAAKTHFGVKNVMAVGEGGTIPFIAQLGGIFPEAQILVTGVLGPGSNAHGPNEYLDLTYVEKVNAFAIEALHAHAQHRLAGD